MSAGRPLPTSLAGANDVRIIVPEYSDLCGGFSTPDLLPAAAAIATGAKRMLLVTVWPVTGLTGRDFSELLAEPFVACTDPLTAASQERLGQLALGLKPATDIDRSRYHNMVLSHWLRSLRRDVQHPLRSTHLGVGALASQVDSGRIDSAPISEAQLASVKAARRVLDQCVDNLRVHLGAVAVPDAVVRAGSLLDLVIDSQTAVHAFDRLNEVHALLDSAQQASA
jgi:hypothetical protein